MRSLLWFTSSGKKTMQLSKSRKNLFNLHHIFQRKLEENNNMAMAALFQEGKTNTDSWIKVVVLDLLIQTTKTKPPHLFARSGVQVFVLWFALLF